jgi:hypothetical protein
VANEFVEFNERAFVEQQFDALASRLFSFGVLLLYGRLTAGVNGFVVSVLQVLQFSCCG